MIDIGTAAHICAAAPLGPRYDAGQSSAERSSVRNGIWMCRDHGKAIDSPDSEFTVAQLLQWKKQAEHESRRRVLHHESVPGPAPAPDEPPVARLRAAAQADLDVFRRTVKWPKTSVSLALKVDGFDGPVKTEALARASVVLDDLILVAPPGMGKTTTLFQIADGLLASGTGIPLIVPLGDWATRNATILASILGRTAFQTVSEGDLRVSASQRGVVLLLDGWNELDAQARKRARVQVDMLKAELPEIGIVVSTRKQAFDVPFEGMRIELLPLDEKQQMRIATALRGHAGATIIERAWRTAGLRELVTIPLYLATLLSLPHDVPFPSTKEEVLRRFVASHENEPDHIEALYAATHGLQQDYLKGLAMFAMHATSTSISDRNARRCIVGTATLLADDWQIASKPDPDEVLETLVSNHLLLRTADSLGYTFQHQQFQEWYAAGALERRIVAEIDRPAGREELKANIFDHPVWEEAILFAVERLAWGDAQQQTACANAILAALEVDPNLAAEMIYRGTNEVWALIASKIQECIARWHMPGTADRALHFMLTSGRFEFSAAVWPLITDEDDQVSLRALRQRKDFRSGILGPGAEDRIRGLSRHARSVLLHEMAWRGDLNALDLASSIAREDPDPEVQATVIDALAIRRADHRIAAILRNADEKTFDLVVAKDLVVDVDDNRVREALARARDRSAAAAQSDDDRLGAIARADDSKGRDDELADLIATIAVDSSQDATIRLIHQLWNRHPVAVARGLLVRLRTGRTLFPGADDLLASGGIVLDDDALLALALAEPAKRDDGADAAASLLGPRTTGNLVDAFLDVDSRLRAGGLHHSEVHEAASGLRTRIAHVPGSSLVAAVLERSSGANSPRLAQLAGLLVRQTDGVLERSRLFDANALATIRHLVEEWATRMLVAGDARRSETAALARLAECAAAPALVPILKRLLDDELRRYRAFRAEAEAGGWLPGPALDESRTPYTGQYQRAFMAIRSPHTAAVMEAYLTDEYFGESAARVLAEHWRIANEPPKNRYAPGGVDFSGVKSMRKARAAAEWTSAEADMIFATVERLISDDSTDEQKRLAVALGTIASRLPHGQRAATMRKLISLASRRKRADLLLNLALSGEEIDIEDVATGIAETFEAAKTERWILTQSDGYELKVWLQLLPFVGRVMEGLPVLCAMPPAQREPRFLKEMIAAFPYSPAPDAEDTLFKLAEEDARFYTDYQWRRAALRLDTPTSAQRVVALVTQGMLSTAGSDWEFVQTLAHLIATSAAVRAQVYALLATGDLVPGLAILARVIAERPDEDGLLLLARLEQQQKIGFVGERTIESVITERVPIEGWSGAHDVVPVAAGSLRRRLLALTTDGGADDVAARYLRIIDEYRDRYGMPETESRHPDLSSGKPWPFLLPDPDAERLCDMAPREWQS